VRCGDPIDRTKLAEYYPRFRDNYLVVNSAREGLSPCWAWMGPISPQGYGLIGSLGGYTLTAYRFSYLWHNPHVTTVPPCVRHLCPDGFHWRCCVNPDHLAAGTLEDNFWDSVKTGTIAFDPAAALPRETVLDILADVRRITEGRESKSRLSTDESTAIGQRHGVHQATVRNIARGQAYRRFTGLPKPNRSIDRRGIGAVANKIIGPK
jgi:hypothetical protein